MMMSTQYNKTTLFLLPMLYHVHIHKNMNIARYNHKLFINSYFVNAFMGILPDSNASNPYCLRAIGNRPLIYCQYNIQVCEDFLLFEDTMMQHPQYRGDYDHNNDVVYVFEIPEEYHEDYNKFLSGNYSGFTDKYKSEILAFWKAVNPNGLFYSILYKNADFVRSVIAKKYNITIDSKEYYPAPIIGEEILIH